MTDTSDARPPEPRVYVRIERDKDDRYSILSTDLETIGAQLRGRPRFSIFNSIFLPAIVTFITFLLTGFFQYISWQNSVRLQGVSEEASAAEKTYNKAASEIDSRFYATYLFEVAVRNLASKRAAAAETQADPVKPPPGPVKPSEPGKTPLLDQLDQYDADQQKFRFEDFYKQLKSWNNNYNQLFGDVSYDLDRPINRDGWTDKNPLLTKEALKNVNCDARSLADEIAANKLTPSELANHLGVVNKCFGQATDKFAGLKDEVLAGKKRIITKREYDDAYSELDNVRVMLNEFRCYALSRIHFLASRKQRTITFADWFDPETKYIDTHIADTAKRCSPRK